MSQTLNSCLVIGTRPLLSAAYRNPHLLRSPNLTLAQIFTSLANCRYKKKLKHFWSGIISSIKYTWVYRKARLVRTDGSFENYVLKSALGFLGGIFLTYIFFVFFVFQLNFTLTSATMLCSILGVILTLGLAFSYRVR